MPGISLPHTCTLQGVKIKIKSFPILGPAEDWQDKEPTEHPPLTLERGKPAQFLEGFCSRDVKHLAPENRIVWRDFPLES